MKEVVTALVLLVATPAAAAGERTQSTPDLAGASDADLTSRLAAGERGESDSCTELVPVLMELSRRHADDRRYQASLLVARATCAYQEQRYAEGLRDLKRAEDEYAMGKIEPLGLALASQLKDGTEVLSRLEGLNASGQFDDRPIDELFWLFRIIRDEGLGDQLDAFSYRIVTSRPLTKMEAPIQTSVAYNALSHAARTGITAHVDDILKYVRTPYTVRELLAKREFEPLWPQIEHYAGDNLKQLSDDYVGWTAALLADKPENRGRLTDYSYALLFAGRFAEAVDVAQGWLNSRPDRTDIEEGDGWALNIQAYSYDALGRPGEADLVFDRLAELNPDEHPWLVNFVINRESRLVSMGRWKEGLAASEVAKPVAASQGSPYARMLVAADRACAFYKLGRTDESEQELAFVRDHVNDAPTAAIQALLCANRDGEAMQVASKVLDDDAHREALLDELFDDRFTLFGSPSTALPNVYEAIMADPQVRAQALKFIRIIPERFVPIAYLRRREIAEAIATH